MSSSDLNDESDQVWRILHDMQEELRSKDDSFSEDCIFNSDDSSGEENTTPKLPKILPSRFARRTPKIRFDGKKLFISELEKLEIYIDYKENELHNRSDDIPSTKEIIHRDVVLYQVSLLCIHL